MALDNAAKSLYGRLWRTKGSRFIAFSRCKRMNVWSITTISILSVYVVFISIISIVFSKSLSDFDNSVINIANIFLSIFIIVFSLIEFSRDHLGLARAMNESALKIGQLYGEYQVRYHAASYDEKYLQEVEGRYAAILREYPDNHNKDDFDIFQSENKTEFSGSSAPVKINTFALALMQAAIYIAAISLPVLIAVTYVVCRIIMTAPAPA